MSQIKKLINQKFLEGIDSTKFHVAQNGAIMAKDSSGSMVEFLKVNSDNKGVVLGKVISTKDEIDQLISDLAAEVSARQAGDVDAKAYADQKIADLVNGAPALLDTLKELADAIGNDENFAATIGTQIGQLQSDLAAEIARAEAAEAALAGRATALEGRMSTVESDLDALEGVVQGNFDLQQSDIEGLRSDVDAASMRIDALEPKVTTLEGEMDEAQGDILALDVRMTTAEGDINAAEGRIDDLDTTVGQHGQQLFQHGLQLSSLSSQKADKTYVDSQDAAKLVEAKEYTDNEVSAEETRAMAAEALKVNKSGDSMSGRLTIKNTSENPYDVSSNNAQPGFVVEGVSSFKDSNGLEVVKIQTGVGRRIFSAIRVSDGSNISNIGSTLIDSPMFDITGSLTPQYDSNVTSKKYVNDQDAAKLNEAKAYTDSEMASEEAARIQGDADTLQSSKDYTDAEVLTEKNRAMGVEGQLRSDLDQEIEDRADAISQEVSDRNAAILVEKERAELAEAGLQSAIDVEKGRVDAILLASDADKDSFAEVVQLINSVDLENDNALAAVVLNLQNVDAELDGRLDSVEGRATSLEGRMTTAEEDIDSVEGRMSTAESSISNLSSTKADKSYVDSQDSGLQSQIDGLDGRLDIIEGADSVEGSIAKAEKDAKDYADSKFAQAQSNLDDAEGYSQDVRDDLDAEIARAQAAEGVLSGRLDTAESKISALEALSFHKEFKTVGASDLMHVDLLLKAKPKSVKIYVGRLALHEDHDFTVGENMGVTRIYWTGDFMFGSEEGIEEGMKLFFEYYC